MVLFVPGRPPLLPSRCWGFVGGINTAENSRTKMWVDLGFCGPEEIRTPDLTRARGALYQLSYWPFVLVRES